MEKIKVRKVLPIIVSLVAIPFILTGCAQRSACDVKKQHVHLYKISDVNGVFYTYLDNEALEFNARDWKGDVTVNYKWQPEYIEVTDEDLSFYHSKDDFFEGRPNWKYLFNMMQRKSKDYLEFYYHYTTTSTIKSGKSYVTQTHHHRGWDTDPTHRGVTGDVRLCHNKYYGYKVVLKNGKYERIQSPLVDDFRDIIDEYPYFDNTCYETVYKEYDFTKDTSILRKLNVKDFDYFDGPDLTNSDINAHKESNVKDFNFENESDLANSNIGTHRK